MIGFKAVSYKINKNKKTIVKNIKIWIILGEAGEKHF